MWHFPGFTLTNWESWEDGESGYPTSMVMASMDPGMVKIELEVEGTVIQEIECELVEP